MSQAQTSSTGYSADVRIELYLNGTGLGVAQLGRDYLILKSPLDHPPAEGELSIQVDGHLRRWRITLPEGIQAGKRMTAISKI